MIANGALPTNYYANTHPSIGNYFMLTTGQLLTNNDYSTTVWNVDNLARRMLAANIPFKIYAEGISRGYVGGNTGPYLIRHNPFAMLSDIAKNSQVANQVIWPFSQFAIDLANGTLPEFSYIVPTSMTMRMTERRSRRTPGCRRTSFCRCPTTPLSRRGRWAPDRELR